jgi:hypothetical protein
MVIPMTLVSYFGYYRYYAAYLTFIAKSFYYSAATETEALFNTTDYSNYFSMLNYYISAIIGEYSSNTYCNVFYKFTTDYFESWQMGSIFSTRISFVDFMLQTKEHV